MQHKRERLGYYKLPKRYLGLPPLPIGVTRIMYHVTPYRNLDAIQRDGLHRTKLPFFTLSGKREGYVFLAETTDLPISAAVYSVWVKVVLPQRFALLEVTVPPYALLFPDPDAYGEAFVTPMDIPASGIRLLKTFDLSTITPLPLEDADARYEREGASGPAGATAEEEKLLERELQATGLSDDEMLDAFMSVISG